MIYLKKIVNLAAILGFLSLALASLAMAHTNAEYAAQKAEYVLSTEGNNSLLTVWVNEETLAFSIQETSQIAVWELWQSENPTFYQVYPEVSYRIEFDRLTSRQMKSVLLQLKQLVTDKGFVDSAQLKEKQLVLSSLDSGKQALKEMNSWSDYKTYDYADIGDNEADPVLGQLIKQGFVRGF